MQLGEFYNKLKRFLRDLQEEKQKLSTKKADEIIRSLTTTNKLLSAIFLELKKQNEKSK